MGTMGLGHEKMYLPYIKYISHIKCIFYSAAKHAKTANIYLFSLAKGPYCLASFGRDYSCDELLLSLNHRREMYVNVASMSAKRALVGVIPPSVI